MLMTQDKERAYIHDQDNGFALKCLTSTQHSYFMGYCTLCVTGSKGSIVWLVLIDSAGMRYPKKEVGFQLTAKFNNHVPYKSSSLSYYTQWAAKILLGT